MNFLFRIFCGKEISFQYIRTLSLCEIKLIILIIKKKFNKIFNFNENISLNEYRDKLYIISKGLVMEGSYKRIEENNKFIFNYTCRNL